MRNGSRLHIPERANGTVKIINNSPAFITQGRDPRLPNALFDEQTTGTGRCAEKLKRRRIRRATIIFEDGRGNPSWGSVVARRRSWRRGLTAVPNKKLDINGYLHSRAQRNQESEVGSHQRLEFGKCGSRRERGF